MCVRARVCVCIRPSTVKASSVWIRWDTREQINDVMLKTLDSSVSSLHRYFRMQNLTFQPAALSCSHTRSGKSHDLTSVRPLSEHGTFIHDSAGVTFGTHYIVSRSAFGLALTRGFAVCLGKVKVATNFSVESSPQQSN